LGSDVTTDRDSEWLTRVTLLEKVKNRYDEEAWRDFVHYYGRYIYGIVRRMNLNHHDAEEVVQTVNVRLWQKLPEFQYDAEKGRFRGWLCRVTGNEVKRFLRRRKAESERLAEHERRQVEVYLDRIQMPDVEALAEEEWRVHVARLAWERIERLFESNAKQAFELISKGRNVKDVAQELGIAESSVYVYKKRVADRLRLEIKRLNAELD
jgi:RNA polymerase sigma factor (sigma-70 family)